MQFVLLSNGMWVAAEGGDPPGAGANRRLPESVPGHAPAGMKTVGPAGLLAPEGAATRHTFPHGRDCTKVGELGEGPGMGRSSAAHGIDRRRLVGADWPAPITRPPVPAGPTREAPLAPRIEEGITVAQGFCSRIPSLYPCPSAEAR